MDDELYKGSNGGGRQRRRNCAGEPPHEDRNLSSLLATDCPDVLREHVFPFLIPQEMSYLLSTDRALLGLSIGPTMVGRDLETHGCSHLDVIVNVSLTWWEHWR